MSKKVPLSSLSPVDRRALRAVRSVFLGHAREAEGTAAAEGFLDDENLFSTAFVRGELPDDDVTGWAYQISQWGWDEVDEMSARVHEVVKKYEGAARRGRR